MADVAEIVIARGRLGGAGLGYIVCEAKPVDTNDTVTIGELSKLTDAKAWRMDTGANITCTVATNVVTITQASLTDVPVLICATGY